MDAGRIFKSIRKGYGSLQKTLLSSGRSWPPLSLFIMVTARCNLACKICFLVREHTLNQGQRRELTPAEIDALVDQTPGFTVITFTGGEPFAREDFPEILERTARKRRVHVISNGTQIGPEMVPWLIGLAPRRPWGKGLIALGISLLGPEEVHEGITGIRGSFQRTCTSVRSLRDERARQGRSFPHLDLKMVLSGPSTRALPTMIPLFEELAPDSVTLQLESTVAYTWYQAEQDASTEERRTQALDQPPPDLEAPTADELTSAIGEFLSRWGARRRPQLAFYPMVPPERLPLHLRGRLVAPDATCTSVWTDLLVGPWGDVCTCLAGSVGNIRQQSLRELRNQPRFRQFRQIIRRRNWVPACRGCCFLQEP